MDAVAALLQHYFGVMRNGNPSVVVGSGQVCLLRSTVALQLLVHVDVELSWVHQLGGLVERVGCWQAIQ